MKWNHPARCQGKSLWTRAVLIAEATVGGGVPRRNIIISIGGRLLLWQITGEVSEIPRTAPTTVWHGESSWFHDMWMRDAVKLATR